MSKIEILAKAKRGFTLIELLAVMAIMVIATSMVLPNIRGIIDKTEFRKTESYCMQAHSFVRNYVNMMNLGEEKVYYEEDGEPKTYSITTPDGLKGALNEYSLNDAVFQYYVLSFKASTGSNPSTTISDSISGNNIPNKDTMVVLIRVTYDDEQKKTNPFYTLKGLWYYSSDRKTVVCSFKSSSQVAYEGFKSL